MSHILEGKTAFVTGGTGGIGSAICERFAREGAQVIAADLAPPAELPERVEFIAYDVTDEDICRNTFNELAARWDKLDILVNAAGIEIEKTIEDTTLEEWNRIFAINVTGMFLTSKYALPLVRKSAAASIINFGSYDGYIADPGLAAYCATKGAVHALTRSIAVDHGPAIRCNAISPGWIMTGMAEAAFAVADDPAAAEQDALARHPAGRLGEPGDIASLAAWLASDEAGFATGQCYTLDGGMTAASPLNPGLF
jgi:NAD(P)-dependent dehydrogenase (short-subunit alcohol dehydrogenase family)